MGQAEGDGEELNMCGNIKEKQWHQSHTSRLVYAKHPGIMHGDGESVSLL